MLYLLLFLFPLAMAATTFVLRKQTALVIVAAVVTVLVQLVMASMVTLDAPTRFLGVTLTLSALNRLFLLVFLAVSGVSFVATWNLRHGENFVPIGLLNLALACAVLMLQDLFIVALLLIITGLTAVLAIVDLPTGASTLVGTRAIAAALKYLILMVVAGVLMYIAFVLSAIFRPGELPGQISLGRFILALVAVSFALRLAVLPFHTWLPDLLEYAEPLVAAMVITLLNTLSLLVLVLVFQSFPALLSENAAGLRILRAGALIAAVLAALTALAKGTLRRTLAYLILFDCAMVFYGFAAVSERGLGAAIFGALNQVLAVTLLLICLTLLERPDGRTPGVLRRDLLRRWPIAGAGLLGAGLALIGLPPFSGYAGKILLYEAAAAHGWLDVTMLLFASVLAGLALVRLAWERLLGPSEELPSPEPLRLGETELDRPLLRRLEPEPRSTALLTVVLLAVCLLIGLFPQPVMATIDRAIDGLAFIRVVDQ